jgi:hypothetical protein
MNVFHSPVKTLPTLLVVMTCTLIVRAQGVVDLTKVPQINPGYKTEMVVKQADGSIRQVDANAKAVQVASGEYVVTRTAERVTEVSSSEHGGKNFQLPVTLTTIAPSGNPIALGIIVRTSNGLMPRGSATQYEGRIFVGLVNTRNPETAIPLPAPVQVTLTGLVDSISPDQLKFEATNAFTPIVLTARNPRDPVQLHLSTGVDISETVVPISVINASLSVMLSVPRIAGFGFETDDVTVQAKGLPSPAGVPVTVFLQGGGGTFLPASQLALDSNGEAFAKLRSSGVSPNVVVAATLAGGATAQAAPIMYVWPLAWLAFAIVGGVLGGIVKQLTASPKSRKGWIATLAVSVTLGFLAAGLYALGVSTIPAIPVGAGGQLVVAVVAALSAIGGVSLLPVPGK